MPFSPENHTNSRVRELEERCRMLEAELAIMRADRQHAVPGTHFRARCFSDREIEFFISNSRFCECFNLAEHILAEQLRPLVNNADWQLMKAAFSRSLVTGEPVREEVAMRSADGVDRWMLIEAVARQETTAKTILWDGRVHPVTSRQSVWAVLTEEEAQYRTLFESSPIIQFIVNPVTLTVIDANPAACIFYGYEREDFRTLPVHTLYADDSAGDMLEQAATKFQTAFHCQHTCADGSVCGVESYITPVLYKGQRVFHYIVRDLTPLYAAQQEAEIQRELLERTMDHMDQGICAVDGNGKMLLWNERFLEIFGGHIPALSKGTHYEEVLRSYFASRDIDGFDTMVGIARSRQRTTFEYLFPTGVIVEIRQTPLPGGGIVRTYADITRQKQTEKALSLANKELQAIFDNSQAGVAMLKGGRFIARANKRFLDMFRYTDESEVVGKSVLVLHHDQQHFQDFGNRYFDRLAQGEVRDVEYSLRRKDGSTIWCEIYGKAVNVDDMTQGVVWLVQDITDKRQAKEALELSESRFRSFVENASDIVLAFSDDCTIGYASPNIEERLLCSVETVVGRNFLDFCHEEDRQHLLALVSVGEKGENRQHVDLRLHKKNGHYHWYEVSISSIYENGKESYIAIMRDISERKHVETLRKDFERIMRHDLKAPLGAIINIPQLVQRRGAVNAEQQELLELVQDAGHQMLEMVNMSLDIYKLEEGTYVLCEEEVNLAALLGRVATDLTPQAQRRSQKIHFEVSDSHVALQAERLLLYSLFSNLVKNALEAAPDESTIFIHLASFDDTAYVIITNKGEVSSKLLPHFFEKYSTAGKPSGTGLGTYAARLAAEVHGGTVGVESREGVTSVSVSLPI